MHLFSMEGVIVSVSPCSKTMESRPQAGRQLSTFKFFWEEKISLPPILNYLSSVCTVNFVACDQKLCVNESE
jgi:hypothetical protein